tara:strand:+ start:297 stop:698 length:402 start_codon:yes stop_codon:yes gene_type:complete
MNVTTNMQDIPEGASILIVKEKYADMLLSGYKTMEIRGMSCKKKVGETVYIAKSGTQQIFGCVIFQGCYGPLSDEDIINYQDLHRVYETPINWYKKTYGWSFSCPIVFENSIPYKKKRGAIVWVKYERELQST